MTTAFIIALTILAIAVFGVGRASYAAGQQNIVNRLIDSRDADAWQYAHFVRADMKALIKPEDRKL